MENLQASKDMEEQEEAPCMSSSTSFPLLRFEKCSLTSEDEDGDENKEMFFTPPHTNPFPDGSPSTSPSFVPLHSSTRPPPAFSPPPSPASPPPSTYSASKRKKVKRFYRSCSTNTTTTTSRTPPVKRIFHRSFSLFLHHYGAPKKYHNYQHQTTTTTTTASGDPSVIVQQLQEFGDGLMHVFRCEEFPPEGLSLFHRRIKSLMNGGWAGALRQVWLREVLGGGVKLYGVRVASPRDGNKVVAAVGAWKGLVATILPLVLALLTPILEDWEVRDHLFVSFRDQVLPYASLPQLIASPPAPPPLTKSLLLNHHIIQHMALRLARVGPCSCSLKMEEEEEEEEEVERSSKEMWKPKDNEAVKILKAMEKMKAGGMDEGTLSNILHLHHGDRHHHQHHHLRRRHHHALHYMESTTRPLTCRPASALTLEELVRSAARR